MSEECGEIKKDDSFKWIIDPIDGTSNFLHGMPHFAISIGLEHENEIICGIIYDPIKDEMFTAEKGNGSYVNNQRIRVSSRSKLKDSLILTGGPRYSSDKKNITFEEYKKFTSKTQKDKDKNLVILYTSDIKKQDSFIETAKKRSYDVVIFDNVIDSHYINHLEQKLDKTQIKRVDADIIDKLIDKDDKKETVISEKDKEALKSLFEKIVDNKSAMISVESLNPADDPVTITLPEFFRRMQDMAKSSGNNPMMMGAPGEMTAVNINGNHKTIEKILKAKTTKTKEKIASQVYDLALLSQNMLTGSELTNFVRRSLDILSK